jgi:hypothetical protein
MVYDLPLVEEKIKPHQVTTLHLICALSFIGAGAIIARYNYAIPMWGLILLIEGFSLLLLVIFKNKWITAPRINVIFRVVEFIVAAALTIYSVIQQWKFPIGMFGVLSACILFSMYWERRTGNKLFIQVDEEGLKLPITSRKRFISWPEVEQVVIRFGTLTVDCADNRLFQWNIAGTSFNSDDFEAFCSQQVEENRSKRRNDEW